MASAFMKAMPLLTMVGSRVGWGMLLGNSNNYYYTNISDFPPERVLYKLLGGYVPLGL